MSARVQGVEIGPAINAEQNGFAIEDEGGVAVTQRGLRGSPPGVQFNPLRSHQRLAEVQEPGSARRWASARLPLQRRTIGRLVTANISLDAGTLAAIDEGAAEHGLTRSAFMASAALEKIQRGT